MYTAILHGLRQQGSYDTMRCRDPAERATQQELPSHSPTLQHGRRTVTSSSSLGFRVPAANSTVVFFMSGVSKGLASLGRFITSAARNASASTRHAHRHSTAQKERTRLERALLLRRSGPHAERRHDGKGTTPLLVPEFGVTFRRCHLK